MHASRLCLYPILAVLAVLSLSGCDNGGGSERTQLRLMNVSPGYTSLDLYANATDDDTDRQRIAAVAYDTVSCYTELESGTYNVKFKRTRCHQHAAHDERHGSSRTIRITRSSPSARPGTSPRYR